MAAAAGVAVVVAVCVDGTDGPRTTTATTTMMLTLTLLTGGRADAGVPVYSTSCRKIANSMRAGGWAEWVSGTRVAVDVGVSRVSCACSRETNVVGVVPIPSEGAERGRRAGFVRI